MISEVDQAQHGEGINDREENHIAPAMATTGSSSRRPPPPLRSASAILAGTESGQHLLKIVGYSHTKDKLPTGSAIKSRSFRVGGHSWYISYYPSGNDSGNADCISVFVQLDKRVGENGVKAQFTFSLLDRAGRPSHSTSSGDDPDIFNSSGWGFVRFIRRDVLEKSEYLRDDCLTIVCDLTVFMELQTEDIDVDTATPPPPPPPPPPTVVVPPPDLHRHLGGLLDTGEGADVTFEVSGKTFAAHRLVLAARSPVFRAELFGPRKELGATTGGAVDHTAIRIDDMEARDFEALLRYMYTDSLPEPETTKGGGDAAAMLPDLVAAASRYKMERLRLVCEHKLCEYVNGRTVVSMLAFAREHHCDGLKEKCLRFLDDPVKVREIVKAEGLDNLSKSYTSILTDLIAKLAAVPSSQT